MRLQLILAGLLLHFGLVTPVAAQPPDLPGGVPHASPPAGDEPFVIEQKHLRVAYEKDGRGRRELRMRVRILREQGAQQWGQLPFPYSSETETLTIDRVQVEKADGVITPEAAGAVQDLAVNQTAGLPMFVDLRQKQVTVSSLRPGDLLEFVATWSIEKPIAPGHFWFEHSFSTDQKVLDERLEIDLPRDSDAILKVRPTVPREENPPAGSSGRRVHRWVTRNLTVPSPDAKPVTYEGDGSPADVRLTTYRSWNDVAVWFGGLVERAKSTDAVAAKAVELTRGLGDPAAKANAIFAFVAREVRYVSLSFGLGRYAPHAPSEVLKNLYGDCKDKVALLSAMLAAVGVDALPVLLHTNRSLDETLASPLELDHVITVVPLGDDPARWLWLDATVDIAPGGMLLAPIRDKRALLVGRGPHATRLIRTPADPPFPSVELVDVTGTVDGIGVLRADVRMSLRGDSEVLLRGLAQTLNSDGLKQLVTGMLEEFGLKGDVSDPSVGDPRDTGEPFQVTAKVRVSGYLDWAATSGDVPALPRLTFEPWTPELLRDEKSVELGTPKSTRLRATITLPAGYALQAPLAVETGTADFSYLSRYTIEGHRFIVERELSLRLRQLEASRFGEFLAFVGASKADIDQKVKFSTTPRSIPDIPAEATARELYAAALGAFRAKNYQAAAALWERTTVVDPKMGDAWISLGLAYSELKQYDRAAAAIQKQIDANPFDPRAYRDLGGIHQAANETDAAITAYARHLEINPLDGATASTLADLYFDSDQPAKAVPIFEKAASLGSLGAWGYADLGEAYLELNRRDDATRAFEKAIELSPTLPLFRGIAWRLASRREMPDRARELALKAEQLVEKQTASLTVTGLEQKHLDLMEDVVWTWDALSMIAAQQRRWADAERYGRAAWLLGRDRGTAFHLGEIYERLDQRADAASFYLTAQSLYSDAPANVRAAVQRFVGEGADIPKMVETARRHALEPRMLPAKAADGKGEYLALVGSDQRVIELKFVAGADAMQQLAEPLKAAALPLAFPSANATRIAVKLLVGCQAGRCSFLVAPARAAKIESQVIK